MVGASNPINEIFELGNKENKELSSACLARKNQRKLYFHQSHARGEFVDVIAEFASAGRDGTRIIELAVKLATTVNDPFAAKTLTAMASEPRIPTNVPAQYPEPEISILISPSASSPI